MKNVFHAFILISTLIACQTKHRYDRQDTFLRDGLMYENVSEILITGLVLDKYPSGQRKSEENYVNGRREGLYSVWYPNGQRHLNNPISMVKKKVLQWPGMKVEKRESKAIL